MSAVTFRDDDSPGTRLIKHEQELRIQHPHLSASHARHLVREAHPDLVALHHEGHPDLDAPPATIDPGELLNRRARALMDSGEARGDFKQALRIAGDENPEAFAAWSSGLRMTASSVRENAEPHVARTTSDASLELLRAVHARQAATGEDATTARKAVLLADPTLARCYANQTPLPLQPARPAAEILLQQALAQSAAAVAEVDQLVQRDTAIRELAARRDRHYRELNAAERAAQPLPTKVRQFSQGEVAFGPPMPSADSTAA